MIEQPGVSEKRDVFLIRIWDTQEGANFLIGTWLTISGST